ncbi:MAG TPA: YraN family protein [Opitutaceae bacterium]|nr:YraN family protein [Opitutaceae bacterium]
MRNIAATARRRAARGYRMFTWFKEMFRARGPGPEGERRAAEHLAGREGYAIVARNWRNPRDPREEIDLVCRDGDVLVFVEVKSRASTALVPGFFAVNRRKKKVLRRAIHAYLTRLRDRPRTFRFDVVEVVTSAKAPPQVLHFQNVPLFPKGYHVLR